MYLLGVLSSDKTNEMTSLKILRTEYAALPSSLPSDLQSTLLQTALAHHTRRFESPTYESLITTLTSEQCLPGSRASSLGPGSSLSMSTLSGAMSFSPNLPPGPQGAPPPLSLEDGGMSWRGKGFLLPPPSAPPTRHAYLTLIEEVLGKYWHAAGMPDDPDPHSDLQPRPAWAPGMPPAPADWVYLATPFVCVLSRPLAVFYSFEKLVDRLSECTPNQQ